MNIAVSILIAALITTPRTLPKQIRFTQSQRQFREAYIANSKEMG